MTLYLPKIIGHRGAAGYAPENTLTGIQTAHDMGITWVEFDVKLTKDSVPVLFHDDTIDRTTNGNGFMKEITYAELKELEAGSWFGESFAGEPIPTLEQALDLLIELDMGLNLEIKPCPAREVETTEAALDVLSHYWDEQGKLLLSSFQIQCLEVAQEMAPEWPRGLLLYTEFPENWADVADHLHAATININGNTVTAEQIEAFKAYGKPVLAYTINDEDRAEWLFDQGIKAVFSDVPDEV
jgi:glycerophosphoryl diester phosphodiesterase